MLLLLLIMLLVLVAVITSPEPGWGRVWPRRGAGGHQLNNGYSAPGYLFTAGHGGSLYKGSANNDDIRFRWAVNVIQYFFVLCSIILLVLSAPEAPRP